MSRGARWTESQYDQYIHQAQRIVQKSTVLPCPSKPADGLNKTERAYLSLLTARLRAGELVAILGHESIKFRVGEHRCWYSPDFPVIGLDGVLEMHEVKGGHVYEDSRVKFQAAKQQYPAFRWVWAQYIKGEWRII